MVDILNQYDLQIAYLKTLLQEVDEPVSIIGEKQRSINCFAYALGLTDDTMLNIFEKHINAQKNHINAQKNPPTKKKAETALTPDLQARDEIKNLVNSSFITTQIEEGFLLEIADQKNPQKGNIVIYSNNGGIIKHAGIIIENNPVKVKSKWGKLPVYEHKLLVGIPIEYGDNCKYYSISDLLAIKRQLALK